jgi:hypothetical protein
MLEGLLLYVCLLPNSEACKNISQGYVIQNKAIVETLETRAKNALGPNIVAASPYITFAVRKEASIMVTKNISFKISESEMALGITYPF